MKTYNIKIIETYVHNIDIEANNEKEALQKAKDYYEVEGDFVADANTIVNIKFKIMK